jgi:hypothetical protein
MGLGRRFLIRPLPPLGIDLRQSDFPSGHTGASLNIFLDIRYRVVSQFEGTYSPRC